MKKIFLILCLILIPVSVNAWTLDTQNAISSLTMPSGSADFNGTLGSNEAPMTGDCTAAAAWTLGAQWTCTGGVATKAGAGTSTLSITSTPIEVNKFYQLTATYTVTAGTLTPSGGGWTGAAVSATASGVVACFYATATTTLTFTPTSAFAGTVTSVLLEEISAYAYWDNIYLSSSMTAEPVMFKKTLNQATGDEIAFHFAYQTNKATSGNDTGILLDMLDTASPGSSWPFRILVGGAEKASINSAGTMNINILSDLASQVMMNLSASSVISTAVNTTLTLQTRGMSTAGTTAITMGTGTHSQTSGSNVNIKNAPVYNQASGTADNKDLQIIRTETALGSGNQYFQTMETAAGFVRGFTNKGHQIVDDAVAATFPVVSVCGTTPALTAGSTDAAGIVTVGSGATTACTITFGTAYTNEPSCIVTPQSNVSAYLSASANTAITVTFSGDMASAKFNYQCIGINGGI